MIDSSSAQPPSIEMARLLVASLSACGVRDVVYSPGSRSAPFAYALAEAEDQGRIRVHIRVDERGAAFFAVGLSRAGTIQRGSPAPVALVATSGGAIAEYHAGIAEASHAELPLIVLSADRPFEMRGVGASQTTEQVGIFASHCRKVWDIPAGQVPTTQVSAIVARALACAQGTLEQRPGPVHLNVALREPLAPNTWPMGDAPSVSPSAASLSALSSSAVSSAAGSSPTGTSPTGSSATSSSAVVSSPAVSLPTLSGSTLCCPTVMPSLIAPIPWEEAIDPSLKTVIVAGDGAPPEAATWAHSAGIPLLAEPSSGVTHSNAWVPHQQVLLQADSPLAATIEQVMVVGRPTLSRPVSALLSRANIRIVVVATHHEWTDVAGRATLVVPSLSPAQHPHPDSQWLPRWKEAGANASHHIETFIDNQAQRADVTMLSAMREVWARRVGCLLLGASNAIRAADLVANTHAVSPVISNRGLAGIDGTIATAYGVAHGLGQAVRAVMGDLTFFHDVSSLAITHGDPLPDVQIVVLDDQGGGIFDSLEYSAEHLRPLYARWFDTTQQVNIQHIAAAYGATYHRATTREELHSVLSQPIVGVSIVHVPIERPTADMTKIKQAFTHPTHDIQTTFS